MPTYYTPRDLAAEMGQSVWTARRVMEEAGIKHHKKAWYRLDPGKEPERIEIAEVRARVLGGATKERRFGRKRIRRKSLDPFQMKLC